MAFDAGKETFEHTFGVISGAFDASSEIMEKLLDRLEANRKYASNAAMADWLKDGNGLSDFTCREDCLGEFKKILVAHDIPFVEAKNSVNKPAILIRNCDTEQCIQLKNDLLTARGNFYQEVSGAQLNSGIENTIEITDKNIISLSGLSPEEAEVLKGKCTQMGKGFTVGIDKMKDGTYTLSCHAPMLMNDDELKQDFCQAYSEMALALNGPNAEIRLAQARADIQFREDIKNLDVEAKDAYIVGADDNKQFIHINEYCFEYGYVDSKDGVITKDTVERVDAGVPDYEEQLQSYLARINNKAVIHDDIQLAKHFTTDQRVVDPLRPEKNAEQELISTGESKLAEKLDHMAKDKIRNDAIMSKDGHYNDKFNHYQDEVVVIMDAIKNDKIPEGYTEKQINEVKEILSDHHMNITDYSKAIDRIDKAEISQYKAGRVPKKIKDLIEEFSDKNPSSGTKKEKEPLERS